MTHRLSRLRLVLLVGVCLLGGFRGTATAQSLPASCTFTDDPPTAQVTIIKAAHIRELRECITELRARHGLSATSWTDSTITTQQTVIKRAHLTELRSALAQVFTATGVASPSYSDDPQVGEPVRRAHLAELRSRAVAAAGIAPVVPCTFAVIPPSIAVPFAENWLYVDVTTQPGCVWTASTASSFVSLQSPATAASTGQALFKIAANPGQGPRQALLTVAGRTVTVDQQGVPLNCSYSLRNPLLLMGADGGGNHRQVDRPEGCPVSVGSLPSYLELDQNPASDYESLYFKFDPNPNSGPRATLVIVAGETMLLAQNGVDDECHFHIDGLIGGQLNIDSVGGQFPGVKLTPSNQCPWIVATKTPWVHVTGATSGNGSETGPIDLSISVDANVAIAQRHGSVWIGTYEITIEQYGDPCVFDVDRTSIAFTSNDPIESQMVLVTAPNGCGWEAVVTDGTGFLRVQQSSNPVGTDTFAIEATNNTHGYARAGRVEVRKPGAPYLTKVIYITQNAAPGSDPNDPGSTRPPSTEDATYYTTDAIGSVRMITDQHQVVLARRDYQPFGVEWNPPTVPGESSLRFAGKERDLETAGASGWGALDYWGRDTTNQSWVSL